MSELSLEQLNAYIDGELDEHERRGVREQMLRDPALRQQVQALENASRRLAGALDRVAGEPLPERLTRALGVSATMPARPTLPRWWQAAAACLLLVAGTLIGYQLPRDSATPVSTLAVNQSLLHSGLLDSIVSGVQVPVPFPGARAVFEPALSFYDTSEQVCRQYLLLVRGLGVALDGVACRDQGNEWRTVALLRSPLSEPGTAAGYAPAAGATGAVIDDVVSALMRAPIAPGAESELLLRTPPTTE